MFDPPLLHVFAARSNPLDWKKPQANWEVFAKHMLDSGVTLTVVECAYGAKPFECMTPPMSDPSHAARFMHVGVRAKTRGWNKENLINLGVQRRPEAQYIAWIDADIIFRQKDWADQTLRALQHYDVIQPWKTCYDLGPNDQHIAAHTSFAHQFFHGKPLAPDSWKEPYWQGDGGKHIYPHCLPGDSLVVPGGRVLAAAVRPFEGELVVIRTASGQDLSCSPNHPILSGGKWVRADSICVGDNVHRHVRGNGSLVEPDKQQPPARIEDIVRAFSERPRANRFAHLLPDNLDNNRSNSKVAQVWTDGDLPAKRDPRRFELGSDFHLGGVVEMRPSRLNRASAHDLLCQTFGLATSADQTTGAAAGLAVFQRRLLEHAGADRLADFAAPIWSNPAPACKASLGRDLSARDFSSVGASNRDIDASTDQDARIVNVHADDPRALGRALAGQIETDEVVYVGRREFRGHLYDLQTENGYIIADNLVTHNSGYAWAMTRQAFEWVGGLFELGGMGSGDHHQALGMAGLAQMSLPPGPNPAYCREVMRWGERAVRHINGNIGYTQGTIEHLFHGRKSDRGYLSRWGMFVEHGFDPHEDLKRNAYGVFEFATNKSALRRDFDRYLQSRNEDLNSM